jgi:hypothetical protein
VRNSGTKMDAPIRMGRRAGRLRPPNRHLRPFTAKVEVALSAIEGPTFRLQNTSLMAQRQSFTSPVQCSVMSTGPNWFAFRCGELPMQAQPNEKARPVAGLSLTYLATHLRHMSRFITGWTLGDSNS